MSVAEDGRSGLVFPLDDSEVSHIKQCLRDAGFSSADQAWLIRVFERPDCFGDCSDDAVFKDEFANDFKHVLTEVVDKLGEPDQTEEDRQLRLSLLFSFLLGFGPIYSEPVRPNEKLDISNADSHIPAWVGAFQRHAVFCAEHLDWRKLLEIRDSSAFLFYDLIPFLFPEGLPLDQVVNLDLLNPIRRQGWSNNDFSDPEQIEFWLIWRFRDNAERCDIINLNTLLQAFSYFSKDVLGDKIFGLLHAIEYATNIGFASGKERLKHAGYGWQIVADELIPFMELLDEREPELSRERASLLKAWWWLSVLIYSRGGLESGLSDELRNRLVASAVKHMGILRKVLRETPEDFEGVDSTGAPVYDFYHRAFEVLLIFSAPWRCLKSLLLAFTEMTKPAVASDLSHWSGSDKEPPPHPYNQIPSWIGIAIGIFYRNLPRELNRDPHLQGLREEFATFCLERLKTKKNDTNRSKKVSDYADENFVEPRSIWRQCYVQALAALRVNPGGRAHRTLFWLSKNDPDENVREYAKKVHRQMRHLNRNKPNLERGSPRRPLSEAFWWLRQAHLLALGKEIDQADAMRTRRIELY